MVEAAGVDDGVDVAEVVAVGAGVAAGAAVESEVDEPESALVAAAGVVLAEPPRLSVL